MGALGVIHQDIEINATVVSIMASLVFEKGYLKRKLRQNQLV